MKLYLDENMSRSEVEALREAGYDVLWVNEVPSLCGKPDEFHAQNAQDSNRVLLTKDVDFGALRTRENIPETGLVYIKPEANTPALAERLPEVIDSHSQSLSQGAYVTVDGVGERVSEAKNMLADMINVVDETIKATGEIAAGAANEVKGAVDDRAAPANSGATDKQLSNEAYAARSVDDRETYPPRDEEMKAWVDDRQATEEIGRNLREASGRSPDLSPEEQQAQMEDRMQDYLERQKQQQMSM